METSTKELPLFWTFLQLEEKLLANQKALVSAALLIAKSNTAQIFGSPTQNLSMSVDIDSTSEWRRGKITKEIRGGSSETGW